MAYFANGTEGMVLDEQCEECHIPYDAPCPLLAVQMMYNYDQNKEGNEDLEAAMDMLISNKKGCMMKAILDKCWPKPPLTDEEIDAKRGQTRLFA